MSARSFRVSRSGGWPAEARSISASAASYCFCSIRIWIKRLRAAASLRLRGKIVAIGVGGLGLLLRVQALRQALQRRERFRLRSPGRGGIWFRHRRGAALRQIHGTEMRHGLGVVGIEVRSGFEGCVAPAASPERSKAQAQQETRTALRGQKIHGFAKRRDRRGGVLLEEENAQIQLRFGHFRIERGGLFVFRAGFVGAFQSRCTHRPVGSAHRRRRVFRREISAAGGCAASKSFLSRSAWASSRRSFRGLRSFCVFACAGLLGASWDCCETKAAAECGRPSDQRREFRPRRMPRHTTRTCGDDPSWLHGRQLRLLVFRRRGSRYFGCAIGGALCLCRFHWRALARG